MAKEKEELKDGPIKVAPENEPVTITRGQLDAIMGQLNELKVSKGLIKPKRVTERTAILRFHDDKPVISYGNVREELENGKRIAYMDITMLGEASPIKVNYLEFLNSANSALVKITSQKAEEITVSHGTIRALNPDEARISTKNPWRADEVEATVTSYQYTAEVEVIEGDHKGETYTVSTQALNR